MYDNIKYNNYTNRDDIIKEINNLEKIYYDCVKRIHDLHLIDMLFMSAFDKSLKMFDTFLFALNENNITILGILTRVQMDCVLSTFACLLSKNPNKFAEKYLNGTLRLSYMKDTNNNAFSESKLCKRLEEIFDYPIYELYTKTSGLIHLSQYSFFNSTNLDEKNGFKMYISRKNNEENLKKLISLSNELGSYFVYFGKILAYYIFESWVKNL